MFKESRKELDEKFAKTDEFLTKIGKQLGGIGANNGAVAEEFFFYGFTATMQVGNIKYDYIERNKERILKKLWGEYDIVLVNSKSLLVIEVKYKLHPNDVKRFYEKKLPVFKQLFPEYKDYAVYGAVAGLSVPEDSQKTANEYGLMCFTQAGEGIKNLTPENLQITEY